MPLTTAASRLSAPEGLKRSRKYRPFRIYTPNLAHLQASPLAQVVVQNLVMRKDAEPARKVLARNLKKLMDRPGAKRISTYQVAGYKKGESQNGRPLSPKTVERIRSGEFDATLDHIQAIAAFFVLEPWQLLVPTFSVDEPPHLAHSREEIAAFKKIEESYEALQRLREPPAEQDSSPAVVERPPTQAEEIVALFEERAGRGTVGRHTQKKARGD